MCAYVATAFSCHLLSNVVTVANGAAAVDVIRSRKEEDQFGLILMDCEMPVLDGFEATHIIKKELGLSIPVVAMTANAMVRGGLFVCVLYVYWGI